MVAVRIVNFLNAGLQLVFTVPLPGRPVFMRQRMLTYDQTHYSIVIVDAAKFLRLWRGYKLHREWTDGSPETWQLHRRYPSAEHGFGKGPKDPVPLAEVAYDTSIDRRTSYTFLWFGRTEHTESVTHVHPVNGVMRTIWLLSQGCTEFPVLIGIANARDLFVAAGADGTSLRTVGELVNGLPTPDTDAYDDAD